MSIYNEVMKQIESYSRKMCWQVDDLRVVTVVPGTPPVINLLYDSEANPSVILQIMSAIPQDWIDLKNQEKVKIHIGTEFSWRESIAK